jgi:hypothetical protein
MRCNDVGDLTVRLPAACQESRSVRDRTAEPTTHAQVAGDVRLLTNATGPPNQCSVRRCPTSTTCTAISPG